MTGTSFCSSAFRLPAGTSDVACSARDTRFNFCSSTAGPALGSVSIGVPVCVQPVSLRDFAIVAVDLGSQSRRSTRRKTQGRSKAASVSSGIEGALRYAQNKPDSFKWLTSMLDKRKGGCNLVVSQQGVDFGVPVLVLFTRQYTSKDLSLRGSIFFSHIHSQQ